MLYYIYGTNISNMARIHTVSFISDYGKLWEIDYTMEDRETIDEIIEVRINGVAYKVNSFRREELIIESAINRGACLYENAASDEYEARDTHHMID